MARTRDYMTSIETEREMQSYRESEEVGFVGKTEKDIVNNSVNFAMHNGRIGDKVLMNIPPYYIHIPEWQRNMSLHRALAIGQNYDSAKWEVPKVVAENGKLILIDGQHRIYGAFKGGIESVVVEVLEMDEVEAIDLFITQSKLHKTMRPADNYKAAIRAGHDEWIIFRDICKANSIVPVCDPELVKNPVGTFTSISDGINMAEQNPALLNRILKLIVNLQWNSPETETNNPFGAKVFRTLKRLFAYYEDDADKMEQILLTECKGSEFYVSNIKWREQCTMFDYLSDIIEKGIKVTSIEPEIEVA